MKSTTQRNIILRSFIFLLSLLLTGCSIFDKPPVPEVNVPTQKVTQTASVRFGPGFSFYEIQKIRKGTQVEILEKRRSYDTKSDKKSFYGQWYHVRLQNGEIGYLPSNVFKRAKVSYVIEAMNSNYAVYSSHQSDTSQKEVRILVPGEKVELLKNVEADKEYKKASSGMHSSDISYVAFEDGTKGWMYSTYIDYAGLPLLPNLNAPSIRYRQGNFKQMVLGWSIDRIQSEYGPPMSKVIRGDTIKTYYSNIHLFHGKTLHTSSELIFHQDTLISALGVGNGQTIYIDYLPFGSWLRAQPITFALQYFNVWFSNLVADESTPNLEETLFDSFFMNIPWIIRIPIQLVIAFVLFIVSLLLLNSAFVVGTYVVGWVSTIPTIPNMVLRILIVGPATILNYFVSLLLIQNVFPYTMGEYFWIIFGLITWFKLLISFLNKINYGRCPNCNHWNGVNVGSVLLGKVWTTSTTKIQTINKRTKAVVSESTLEDKETKESFEDYQACTHCGHRWSLGRTEYKSGHV